MPLNKVFLRPEKRVSTKTLLLKHYYRRQGGSGSTSSPVACYKAWIEGKEWHPAARRRRQTHCNIPKDTVNMEAALAGCTSKTSPPSQQVAQLSEGTSANSRKEPEGKNAKGKNF